MNAFLLNLTTTAEDCIPMLAQGSKTMKPADAPVCHKSMKTEAIAMTKHPIRSDSFFAQRCVNQFECSVRIGCVLLGLSPPVLHRATVTIGLPLAETINIKECEKTSQGTTHVFCSIIGGELAAQALRERDKNRDLKQIFARQL